MRFSICTAQRSYTDTTRLSYLIERDPTTYGVRPVVMSNPLTFTGRIKALPWRPGATYTLTNNHNR